MDRYEFSLRISPEAYLDYYRGLARVVIVPTTSGERLQFPARLLVKFVTNGGIEGRFVLLCDANLKCVDLRRIGA
jgi:hypothetical protein